MSVLSQGHNRHQPQQDLNSKSKIRDLEQYRCELRVINYKLRWTEPGHKPSCCCNTSIVQIVVAHTCCFKMDFQLALFHHLRQFFPKAESSRTEPGSLIPTCTHPHLYLYILSVLKVRGWKKACIRKHLVSMQKLP